MSTRDRLCLIGIRGQHRLLPVVVDTDLCGALERVPICQVALVTESQFFELLTKLRFEYGVGCL